MPMKKFVRNVRKIKPRTDIAFIYRAFGIEVQELGLEKIQQIQANEATIDLMRKNLTRGAARAHNWNPKTVGMAVSFHMLNWAPETNNDIPLNEIWVYDLDEL